MFTFKKTKEGFPNIDTVEPHSTNEMHFVGEQTNCVVCKKSIKDGEKCGLLESEGHLEIAHLECPK